MVVALQIWLLTTTEVFYILPDNPTNVHCPSQPCATLSQYLLDNNGTLPVASNVEYHFLPGEHQVTTNVTLKHLNNFTLCGEFTDNSSPVMLVFCSHKSFLYITNSFKVKIANITFKQCGMCYQQRDYKYATKLFLIVCSSCMLEYINFLEFGLTAHYLIGESSLRNINVNSSTQLQQSVLHYFLISLQYKQMYCPYNFTDVVIVEMNNIHITGKGYGGIDISQDIFFNYALVNYGAHIYIILKNSQFHSMNKPVLHVVFTSAVAWIYNCIFTDNEVELIYRPFSMIQIMFDTNCITINFTNCTLKHNINWKFLILAASIYIKNCWMSSVVTLHGSNIENNRSPLLYFDGKSSKRGCIVNVTIEGPVTIASNSLYDITDYGVLHMRHIIVNLHGPVIISDNTAQITDYLMLFESCEVQFSGEIKITSNHWMRIILIRHKPSYIKVKENTTIMFSDNASFRSMIVHELEISNHYLYPYCTFQYETMENRSCALTASYMITFENNLISSKHGTCELDFFATHCRWLNTSVFYGYNPGIINQQIMQADQHQLLHHMTICYCSHNITNCSVDVLGPVYPGQVLQVDLCVPYNNEDSILYVETQSTQLPTSACRIGHQTELVNTITKHSKIFNFTIVTDSKEICELFLTASPCLYYTYEAFYIEILPCPVGFTLQSGVCDCDPYLRNSNIHIDKCYIDQSTITRLANTWITAHHHSNNTKYLLSHNCPMDYCLPHSSHLNLLNPDLQCQFNRTDILCSQCQHSLSMVFGSSRCIHCTNIHILITIIVILAGIVLVVLLYLLNLTVTNGTINGTIFYANIISINDSVFLVNSNVFKPLRVFISFVNLDLGIETCFYNGMDGYAKMFLQLFFPFYLIVIAISIIIVSRYSSRILRWTYTRSLPVLATLFLLSYTSVLRAVSMVLFSYSTITQLPSGHQQLVWSIDASVPLFGFKFTILFIICLVLFLLLIPFNIILLFTRYLSQFRIVNQFKPLLDAFQGSYKDRYYYWVGVHLIFRSLFFSFYAFQAKHRLILTAIILILLTTYNGYTHPNKNKLVNIQELLLLLNLTIMYVVSYQGSGSVFSTVTNVMISLAFIQVCTIVSYHFIIYTCHCNVVITLHNVKEKMIGCCYRKNNDHQNNIDLAILDIPERTYNYSEYREGLVSDDFYK